MALRFEAKERGAEQRGVEQKQHGAEQWVDSELQCVRLGAYGVHVLVLLVALICQLLVRLVYTAALADSSLALYTKPQLPGWITE